MAGKPFDNVVLSKVKLKLQMVSREDFAIAMCSCIANTIGDAGNGTEATF